MHHVRKRSQDISKVQLVLTILVGLALATAGILMGGFLVVWIVGWFGPQLPLWQGCIIAIVISALTS